MNLKDRIKAIAKAKKIPVYKVEQEAGIPKGSISKWTKSMPSADKLENVADVLGVTTNMLLKD